MDDVRDRVEVGGGLLAPGPALVGLNELGGCRSVAAEVGRSKGRPEMVLWLADAD
jgi:hypothetical protein